MFPIDHKGFLVLHETVIYYSWCCISSDFLLFLVTAMTFGLIINDYALFSL